MATLKLSTDYIYTDLSFQSKKLRLISFWMEEKQDESIPVPKNMWMRKSIASFESDKKTRTHLDSFMAEIKQTGVSPEGIVLCNCEVKLTGRRNLIFIC